MGILEFYDKIKDITEDNFKDLIKEFSDILEHNFDLENRITDQKVKDAYLNCLSDLFNWININNDKDLKLTLFSFIDLKFEPFICCNFSHPENQQTHNNELKVYKYLADLILEIKEF